MLWAIEDIGARCHVASIASVSGGSLTNAYLAMKLDVRRDRTDEFDATAEQLATRLASRWGMLGSWPCLLYIAAAAGLLAGAAASAALTSWPIGLKAATAVAAVAVAMRVRGAAVDCHFKKILGKAAMAKSLTSTDHEEVTNHVICATSMRSGEHPYMSPRFLFSPIDGWADAKGLRWCDAVRASAAFPIAFPPSGSKRTSPSSHWSTSRKPRRLRSSPRGPTRCYSPHSANLIVSLRALKKCS